MKTTRPAFVLVALASMFMSLPWAHAGTRAKVLRAKGNKAVIRIDGGESLRRGDRLEFDFVGAVNTVKSSAAGRRRHFVGGELQYNSGSTEVKRDNVPATSTEQTQLDTAGLLGWNHGSYEFGPRLSYETTNTDGETSSDGAVGGFYEYNFQKTNQVGVLFVPSVGANLDLKFKNTDNSAGNGLRWSLYIGGKYFALTETLAFTGFLAYESDSVSYANGRADTYTGTSLLLGLRQYL